MNACSHTWYLIYHGCIELKKTQCTASLYLARQKREIMWSEVMWPRPRPLQAQSTSRFSRDGSEWSTLRRFHCGHIWTHMLDNVFVIYLPTSIIFLRSTPPTYCLLCADCCYLFRLIKLKNSIKTSACIYHIVLATVRNNGSRSILVYARQHA
jgi:hypothetical protein